jgi:hAT family C-terminal dimerisation region
MAYCQTREWDEDAVAHAMNAMLRAIEEYGRRTSEAAAVPQPIKANSGAGSPKKSLDEVWTLRRKRRRVEKESELNRYLEAPAVDAHTDILEWWKQHAHVYPGLARIARDYLAIPATSAPAERVFSRAADLISDKRGSLNEDTIQACMCLSSWL